MNKYVKWIAIALAVVLLFVGAYFLYNKLSEDYDKGGLVTDNDTNQGQTKPDGENESEQNSAPDFTVKDMNGKDVKLSDFKGKPVVLNFWASWCYYCKEEMPVFDKVYKEMGDKVHFVMLNVTDGKRETIDSAKKFLSGKNYEFPVYFDTKLEAAMLYGASSLPITFFINAEGKLVTYAMGAMNEETLKRGIEMIS